MLPVAVVGCSFSYIGIATGVTTITSSPSTTTKAEGNFVYRGTVNFTLSGGVIGTFNQTASVDGSFNITATKTKVDNEFVLRQTDASDPIDVEFLNSASPFNTTTIPVTVIILSAGQIKFLAN
jgi:hypothetical protein